MKLELDLHRALAADWQNVQPSAMNRWQRQAAATGGWVTPGNVISVVGLVLVVVGLACALQHQAPTAAGLILLGRLADLADGYVADKTGTKSPLGEAVDATIDKIVMALMILVLFYIGGIALWFGVAILVHFFFNIGAWVRASQRSFRLHPTRLGKLTTFAMWVGAIVFVFGEANSSEILRLLARISMTVFIVLALAVAVQYSKQIRKA